MDLKRYVIAHERTLYLEDESVALRRHSHNASTPDDEGLARCQCLLIARLILEINLACSRYCKPDASVGS